MEENKKNQIKLFQSKEVRTLWDDEKEDWYFSIVDVISILTNSVNPSDYWYRVKKRMNEQEKSELSTICRQLKLKSSDGKKYLTDVAYTKGILRIIQSIPSPKAEPFKQWLAKIGSERLDEIADPEKAIQRAVETYRKKGYSEEWINQRLKTIEMRKELTDEWKRSGISQGKEYAILTNEITKAWADISIKDYKKIKGIKKENLRDNMSNLELVLNMLAEVSTTEISKETNPKGFEESKLVAKKGGSIAKNARLEIEKNTKKKVIENKNNLKLK